MSDDEREAVAGLLKGHYATGRLTEDELAARVAAAYRARYASQLATLTADLPVPSAPAAAPARFARIRPIAAAILALVCLIVLADAVPAELWALFFLLVVPMLLMIVAMFAPFVLPVLGIAWLARALARPRHDAQHVLPPHRRATF